MAAEVLNDEKGDEDENGIEMMTVVSVVSICPHEFPHMRSVPWEHLQDVYNSGTCCLATARTL